MKNKTNITMEHIIAKIDNDFNPDNTDWIARVPAWCLDAMQQLKVCSTVKRKRKLEVKNRIAYSNCCIIQDELKVYDKNGCEIVEAGNKCCTPSTGGNNNNTKLSDTINYTSGASDVTYGNSFSIHSNTNDVNKQHKVLDVVQYPVEECNYVLIDDRKLELNFDTDYIIIENLELNTVYSDYFKCDVPVIPNDGNLIEGLAYYCMYKMLTRGMKHPVFNLNASQYGTNPYYMWTSMRSKIKTSVINTMQGEVDTRLFQSSFYNYTFKPRG